jgi:GntR family transcriptional regulator
VLEHDLGHEVDLYRNTRPGAMALTNFVDVGYSRRTVTSAGPQRVTKQSATRQQVMDLIERLGVGNAIPSERQLSADLGVSRLTVRAALDDLAREGYLIRRRGSGTYVQQPKIAQELTMTSFSEDMRRRGMVPGSRTLSLTRELAGARLGRLLHVSPSEEILVIKRLRLADGETMAIETLHLPAALVPGLEPQDLAGSFYELLRERYGVVVAAGTQAIEPTVTNEEESKALGVPLHSPAFLFERTSRDEAGQTIEFVQSVYRGDRYRIVTELGRPA